MGDLILVKEEEEEEDNVMVVEAGPQVVTELILVEDN